MGKIIDEMILSKINDKGLRIAYFVSSVLSKVFLINLLIGVILNLYIYGLNIHYGKMNDAVPYNWLTTFILSFILPMVISFVPYILIRLIVKLIKEKIKEEIDQEGVLFAAGSFLIINNIGGLIGIIDSVANLVIRMQWKAEIDIIGFINPFMNIIIPIIYILIGLKYIKMSNYLKDKIAKEQI